MRILQTCVLTSTSLIGNRDGLCVYSYKHLSFQLNLKSSFHFRLKVSAERGHFLWENLQACFVVTFFFFFKFVPVLACCKVCPLLSVKGLWDLSSENVLVGTVDSVVRLVLSFLLFYILY